MKIICIGRNYLPHIKELGHQVPENPTFFLKPDSSVITRNRPFFLPDFSQQMEYEVEILVRIDKVGKCIQERFAHTYYHEIGLGIDFTARDLQKKCIERGDPWEIAKAFDGSAVISQFIEKEQFANLSDLHFHLDLNGTTVQFTLKTGDIIFTGTPKGVGKVAINDRLEGYLEDRKLLNFKIK